MAQTGQLRDQVQAEWLQNGFRKGRSFLTNLISFFDQVTHLVKERKAVDVDYVHVREVFDTFSHRIILEKLAHHGLDRCSLCWLKTGWIVGSREW